MSSLILVDVDGVLNPFQDVPGFEQHTFRVGNGSFRVNLNPEHGKWLLDLAHETNSQLVWCTMWEHYAKIHIAPVLGLPDMPYVPIRKWKMSSYVHHDKAFSALSYAGDNRFAYFDDEYGITGFFKDYEEPHNGFHIAVEPDFGLQRSHISQARNWLLS